MSKPLDPRELGRTGLTVSAAGFGGYRIVPHLEEHAQALELALTSGINLIDTSSNYTDGGSETLVGRVLARLREQEGLRRQDVVVVSKAGYLEGRELVASQERKARGEPWPETVPVVPGVEHCLHPDYLDHALAQSSRRLGLERIDVYLLHDPEHFLEWAQAQGQDPAQARDELYRRLEAAFRFLEGAADQGRISFYGVSSNTFPFPAEHPLHLSLARLWEIAQGISPRHRFAVVQMPLNLCEPGAACEANQPGGLTPLAFARAQGLGVLTNRPLHALTGRETLRLAASGLEGPPPSAAGVQERLEELLEGERLLRGQLLPNLEIPPEQRDRLAELVSLAPTLISSWRELAGLEHFRQVEANLVNRLNAAMAHLADRLAGSREGLSALDDHLGRVRAALEAVYAFHAARADALVRALVQRVEALEPDWRGAASPSALALRAVRSTAGVSCVLVGMRQPRYVREVLAELKQPVAVAERRGVWEALAREQPCREPAG
jgi:hypothetical protein